MTAAEIDPSTAPAAGPVHCAACACTAAGDHADQQRREIEVRQARCLESIGSLAAGIAHEINTPLQYVGDSVHFLADGLTDLLELLVRYRELRDEVAAHPDFAARAGALVVAEDELDAAFIEEETPRAITRTFEGIGRVTSIVHAMKEFSHPGGVRALADLTVVVRSAVTVSRHEYKNIADLVLDLHPAPPVLCERGDVGQVVVNLVVNAAHAIADRAARDDPPRIDVAVRPAGAGVEIVVADNGDGIDDAIRSRVIDPFFTTKAPGRGTGQGLALAQAVMERHDGTMAIDTAVGRGTTVTCWFSTGAPT